jgi:aspartate racemase
MKTIGILGGMSAASTLIYYRTLCDLTRTRLGGLHSPELLIRSIDFAPIADLQAKGEWDALGVMLNGHAKALERAGADMIVLATNTMHKLAGPMMADVNIPLIHIADATAEAIRAAGHKRPGLMATAFTMEQDFYTARLRAHGLDPIIPNADDRAETHRIIYDELCRDITTDDSRRLFEAIATRLATSGADSLILGCTEVGMLLHSGNVPVPVFDTVAIHCAAALDAAIS